MSEHVSLDKMTVLKLRELAKELGVVGTTGMKKEELVREIIARKPELAPVAEKHAPAKKAAKIASTDFESFKKERKELKRRISEALAAKDHKLVKELRARKKRARRILKKARTSGALVAAKPAAKPGSGAPTPSETPSS